MLFSPLRRRGLGLAAPLTAFALLASPAAALDLILQTTLSGTPASLGFGNPGSVAATDGKLFVGNLFANAVLTQIDNPLGSPVATQIGTGPASFTTNGYTNLDTNGTLLVAATNNGGADPDVVEVYDVSGPGSATLLASSDSATLGVTGSGGDRFDGAGIDPITGEVFLTAFGGGQNLFSVSGSGFTPSTLDPTPSDLSVSGPTSTGWRDVAYNDATGDIYLRATNGVAAGLRNPSGGTTADYTTVDSLGASAGLSQIVGSGNTFLQDSFQSAINIEFLPASFTGTEDAIITSTRQPVNVLTPFADQVLLFDANSGFDGLSPLSFDPAGVPLTINFFESDGVTPFDSGGSSNGIYDFSFDAVNEVLWVADGNNGAVYGFGLEAIAGIPGDFDNDGDVDDDDFGVFAGAFGGGGPLGDFDNDGDVDDDDFGVFAGNFGTGVPSASIPEPASAALALFAAAGLAAARRR